jgi:hypothetical protein
LTIITRAGVGLSMHGGNGSSANYQGTGSSRF